MLWLRSSNRKTAPSERPAPLPPLPFPSSLPTPPCPCPSLRLCLNGENVRYIPPTLHWGREGAVEHWTLPNILQRKDPGTTLDQDYGVRNEIPNSPTGLFEIAGKEQGESRARPTNSSHRNSRVSSRRRGSSVSACPPFPLCRAAARSSGALCPSARDTGKTPSPRCPSALHHLGMLAHSMSQVGQRSRPRPTVATESDRGRTSPTWPIESDRGRTRPTESDRVRPWPTVADRGRLSPTVADRVRSSPTESDRGRTRATCECGDCPVGLQGVSDVLPTLANLTPISASSVIGAMLGSTDWLLWIPPSPSQLHEDCRML